MKQWFIQKFSKLLGNTVIVNICILESQLDETLEKIAYKYGIPKYTRKDIRAMSAEEYKFKLYNETGFKEYVNKLYV